MEFTDERIPDEDMEKTLEAKYAPSPAHAQAMKSCDLLLIGAEHEGFSLGKLITTVFLEV